MLLCTNLAPRLVEYRLIRATPAASGFSGVSPVFLPVEPLVFLPLWGIVPLPVVPPPPLLLVCHLGSDLRSARLGYPFELRLPFGLGLFRGLRLDLAFFVLPPREVYGASKKLSFSRAHARPRGDRPSGLNSGQLRGGSPPTENTFMEQLPQRGSVPQIGVFHTPRLRNMEIRISPAGSQSLIMRAGHHSPATLFWLVFGTSWAPRFASWPAQRLSIYTVIDPPCGRGGFQ